MKIVKSFFESVEEYKCFLVYQNVWRKAVPDFACMATLLGKQDKFLYTLELRDAVTRERHWISEYVRPFKPKQKKLNLFNAGCAELARRLQKYLATGELDAGLPPAFGTLACKPPKADKHSPPPLPPQYNPAQVKAPVNVTLTERHLTRTPFIDFPHKLNYRLVKCCVIGQFEFDLVKNVICTGSVQSSHQLIVYEDGQNSPIYVIAAEINDLPLNLRGDGTHFLGLYDGAERENHGCSDEWGDISKFEREACELMSLLLGINVVGELM